VVERRPRKPLQHRVRQLIGEIELDPGPRLAELREPPFAVEVPERAAHQRHGDPFAVTLRVRGRKCLAHAAEIDVDRRDGPFGLAHRDFDRAAPGQKPRIGLDVLDEFVHLCGAVRHERLARDGDHATREPLGNTPLRRGG